MAKKDMGLSLFSLKENKVIFKISYQELRLNQKKKEEIRFNLLSGDYKLYCNCNPKAKIEKKIDIALRIYDAKRNTREMHKYNCTGTPITTEIIEGCYRNDDGVLTIKNVKALSNNGNKTDLITIVKNINYEIWNESPIFHYKKATHEKIKNDLIKNNIKTNFLSEIQNIILFHRKIFSSMQENQIVLDGKDLSYMLYNNPSHKFKDLKENELQYFQMILLTITKNKESTIIKCLNNFCQEETFIINDGKLSDKILKYYNNKKLMCVAGFVKNKNNEKIIEDCLVYEPSKKGLPTTIKEEKILMDLFTDKNIKFKAILNYEFKEFYHPMFILEEKNGNDILYDLILKNKDFKDIEEKTKLANNIGLTYRYWKPDFSKTPFLPKEIR